MPATDQPRIQVDPNDYLGQMYRDPGVFARRVLNMEPTHQQDEAHRAIAEGSKELWIRSGHGIGKTSGILAVPILWMLGTRPSSLTVCTATTEAQLKVQLWREMRIWTERAAPWFRDLIQIDATRAYSKANPNDSQVIMRVAKLGSPESVAGFHHDHLTEIVDEGSGVPDETFESIDGCLTKADNRLIVAGNPTRTSGRFWEAFNKPGTSGKLLHFSSLDSPMVTKEYCEKIARKFGERSNIYRVRVLGEFPEGESDALIPLSWVEDAEQRRFDFNMLIGHKIIIGVDPARSLDGDASGLVARCGPAVIASEQHWTPDTMEVVGLARAFRDKVCNEWDLDWSHFAVDTIGLGAGVADRLKETEGVAKVKDVNVALPPIKKYREPGMPEPARLRDELWLEAREWIRHHGCLNGDEVLAAELAGPKFSLDSNGKVKVESKKDMKKRGLASPNLADALCLTFATHNRPKRWVL